MATVRTLLGAWRFMPVGLNLVGLHRVEVIRMDLFEAVVLSQLLMSSSPTARRLLFARPESSSEEHDQRRRFEPEYLHRLVCEHEARLGHELAEARRVAKAHLARSAALGFTPLVCGRAPYPDRLAQIADPPPVLWTVGSSVALQGPAVAVVGSRSGSPYAMDVAETLADGLARRGVVVVSGLARGVDAAAHRGALRGSGRTVGVLGCGLDVVYPPEHRQLIDEIKRSGAVVSELGPSVPPRRFNFPRRNRIISGLSAAVVVVEATERSGSLITARCAGEQGRDVMAVPGGVLTGRNRGGHALLRDGAKVVETADDILDEIGAWGQIEDTVESGTARPADPVLRLMEPGETYDLQALADISGLGGPELSSKMVDLELQGLVGRSEMGRFRRLRG